MNEEKNFDNDTELENLRRLLIKRQSVDERMYAVIRELVRPIANIDGITPVEAISLLRGALRLLPMSEVDYPVYEKNTTITERLVKLCAYICFDELTNKKRRLADYFPVSKTETESGVIAYSKNALSDKAYRSFARHVPSARVSYGSDFTSVCEAVYYEKAEYCILPLENSTDGRLNGFYNLILKYELFVCLCTDIYNDDGEGYTRFALCKKDRSPFGTHRRENQLYGEFFITPNDDYSVSDILFCADYLGVKGVKVDCMPTFGDSEYGMYATFDCKESELFRFLLFFEAEQIRYSAIGIYTII